MFTNALEALTNVVSLKQLGHVVGNEYGQLDLRFLLAIDNFGRKSAVTLA